ncbi:Crp/Fnr family transcriptional regulator [Paenibacillus oralis]|uniref:Crp/Fnr family transcriptional regulator n=1 Tax=Paenibacillus oralis TaxID=2490856 RepID=A0A3P3U1S7_9BACL|nr:Crp/Fnr family transcriptional regulator [Paenibacillus oralis]RRJ64291.1 Crp/Fnr family transcriptional regulator [Paenibacillus oralis]
MNELELIRSFPFFEHLTYADLAKIAPLFITREYDKGTIVFHEADEGDELYLIQSGIIHIYRNDENREIILSVLSEGDFFGEMALLESVRDRAASARAIEKPVLYVLKRRDFICMLMHNPLICLKILETALSRLSKANEVIMDLTLFDARTRIVRTLLRLIEQHGTRKPEGFLIAFKLTHQQLADMSGTVRETVTKVMQDLQCSELIQVNKKIILVRDPDKLKQSVGL